MINIDRTARVARYCAVPWQPALLPPSLLAGPIGLPTPEPEQSSCNALEC